MTSKQLTLISIVCMTMVGAILAWVVASPHALRANAGSARAGTNPLGVSPFMVHRLIAFESAADFAEATRSGTGGFPITLGVDVAESYPISGSCVMPLRAAPFKFTELLPSWNVNVPDRTGVIMEVRVRDAGSGALSPWLYVGNWGQVPGPGERKRITSFDGGEVQVDILVLNRPAIGFQIRATLFSYDPSATVSPSLRKLAAVVSRSAGTAEVESGAAATRPATVPPDWQRDLPVPFRAQGAEARSISHSICSPTSVSMVMQYFGVDRPTAENAEKIYDNDNGLFGNWNRAVQRPASLGMDSYLTRLNSMEEARNFIARGQPLVASIRFASGEFPSNLQNSTDGHLVVIRGFNAAGDAIVNDPASREKGNGVIYKSDELARAWFQNAGGVTYVIKSATR